MGEKRVVKELGSRFLSPLEVHVKVLLWLQQTWLLSPANDKAYLFGNLLLAPW